MNLSRVIAIFLLTIGALLTGCGGGGGGGSNNSASDGGGGSSSSSDNGGTAGDTSLASKGTNVSTDVRFLTVFIDPETLSANSFC